MTEPPNNPSNIANTELAGDKPLPPIRIHTICGDIGQVGTDGKPADEIKVDAVAVGHYEFVAPVQAERALDLAISGKEAAESNEDLIITQFTKRQIITGDKAHPFFLPDPLHPERLIAIAGMGAPRKFSVPELSLLVRQLCWSLGFLGRKHLATVLIGAGNGNLSVEDAVDAWLRGFSEAIEETSRADRRLQALTFVELGHDRLKQIHGALERLADRVPGEAFDIRPVSESAPPSPAPPMRGPHDVQPNFLIAEISEKGFRIQPFGSAAASAWTESSVDHPSILKANEQLIEAQTKEEQLKLGESLHRNLFTGSIWDQLPLAAPPVVICSPNTADVAWEMLAEPGDDRRGIPASPQDRFLGLARGLTRQLTVRSETAMTPRELGNSLKVLIVADPAKDKPLPSARAEGDEVARQFNSHEDVPPEWRRGNQVEVKYLSGEKATPAAVIEELQNESYDAFHFAGHCSYDPEESGASGLVFSGGELLSPEDISRLHCVPSCVFVNACHSGLLPTTQRQVLAKHTPSIAAAFLRSGVGNFVCAAWPVDDQAGLLFATRLYENLLGLAGPPQPMHIAMRRARIAVWEKDFGLQTWGAYQHYGDPYFRFFPASQ